MLSELYIKSFQELTTEELYEILRTREAVFIVEQRCPYPEADGKDYDAMHLFYRDEYGRVVAYLRLYDKKGEPGTIQVGRVVTAKRGIGLGRRILHDGVTYAIESMNARRLYLHSQVYAIGFYEKEGFTVASDEFMEDEIPHVQMRMEASAIQ